MKFERFESFFYYTLIRLIFFSNLIFFSPYPLEALLFCLFSKRASDLIFFCLLFVFLLVWHQSFAASVVDQYYQNKELVLFLAYGPMTTVYQPEVVNITANLVAKGYKVVSTSQ